MALDFRFLSQDAVPSLYRTFVDAFADYALDMSYMNEANFLKRAIKNGVDFASSVGVYDGHKLVGYTLVGLDNWKGESAGFDIGTGILKPYRGKGVAKAMFEFAVPRLKDLEAKKFVLEVLQGNLAAVKAYQKSGFQVVRELDCFELNVREAMLLKKPGTAVEVRPVDSGVLRHFESSLDWHPSWENGFSAVRRIAGDVLLLEARHNGQLAGLLVYYPALNWIMNLVVKRPHRRQGVATALMERVLKKTYRGKSSVKVLNIDHSDTGMISFLNQIGFVMYVNQFEMERRL
jgi:ribosomal protein S18 acetylase RimI-like enzyme